MTVLHCPLCLPILSMIRTIVRPKLLSFSSMVIPNHSIPRFPTCLNLHVLTHPVTLHFPWCQHAVKAWPLLSPARSTSFSLRCTASTPRLYSERLRPSLLPRRCSC